MDGDGPVALHHRVTIKTEECGPGPSEPHSDPAGGNQAGTKHVKVHELSFSHAAARGPAAAKQIKPRIDGFEWQTGNQPSSFTPGGLKHT